MDIRNYDQDIYKPWLIVLAALLFVLLNFTGLQKQLGPLVDFTSPIFVSTVSRAEQLRGAITDLGDIGSLREENSKLLLENVELKNENEFVKLLIDENQALKAEMEFDETEQSRILAEVLTSRLNGSISKMLVSKGSLDGVEVGDDVRFGGQFIGQVSSVNADFAEVATIVSAENVYEVRVLRDIDLSQDKESILAAAADASSVPALAVGNRQRVMIENVDTGFELEVGQPVIIVDDDVEGFLYLGDIEEVVSTSSDSGQAAFVKLSLNLLELNYVTISTR